MTQLLFKVQVLGDVSVIQYLSVWATVVAVSQNEEKAKKGIQLTIAITTTIRSHCILHV